MGTAGPIRLAKEKLLSDNSSGLIFVFNSDVICEFPLKKLVEFHKNHGKEGTIIVTTVEDPTKYGVVISKEDGLIT
jgi:mannose-1-phosphate guanylyltransferase